jgi:hypothetical protein
MDATIVLYTLVYFAVSVFQKPAVDDAKVPVRI